MSQSQVTEPIEQGVEEQQLFTTLGQIRGDEAVLYDPADDVEASDGFDVLGQLTTPESYEPVIDRVTPREEYTPDEWGNGYSAGTFMKDSGTAELIGHELPVATHELGHQAGAAYANDLGYDAGFNVQNANYGDGPGVELIEKTPLLPDHNDDFEFIQLLTEEDDLILGHAGLTGSDLSHPIVDGIHGLSAVAGGGLTAPLSTLWADDKPESFGRRIGALASSSIWPLYHGATEYHLENVAPEITAGITGLGAGLTTYNTTQLLEQAEHVKKRNQAQNLLEEFQENPGARHIAEEAWHDYKEKLDEEDTSFLDDDIMEWDVYRFLEEATQPVENYSTLREEEGWTDKVNPVHWWSRRKKRKDKYAAEELLGNFAQYYEQVKNNTGFDPSSNPVEITTSDPREEPRETERRVATAAV